MSNFCGLSLGLSLVFGFVLFALAAQLYYYMWWRKRRTHSSSDIEMDQGSYPKALFHWGCWKVPRTVHAAATNNISSGNVNREEDHKETKTYETELGHGAKDFVLMSCSEESVESELMRRHNLAGPPRFLFTIKEETKEDFESEDGRTTRKGSRTRSLSDLMLAIDTPFLTPVCSSPLKCPLGTIGFNPLFESSIESEFNRFRSSPPPKFKFMRDAEEKLYRRLVEEARRKPLMKNHVSVPEFGVKDTSIATVETENKEVQHHLPQFHSGSSQVLPLASSPTAFIPFEKTSMVH